MGWLAKLLGLNWITGVLIGALLLAGGGASLVAWWQSGIIERLDEDLTTAQRQLNTCTARAGSILEDKARDDKINNLGRDDLLDLGTGFVRPSGPR